MTDDRAGGPEETGSEQESVSEAPVESDVVEGEILDDEPEPADDDTAGAEATDDSEEESGDDTPDDDEPTEVRPGAAAEKPEKPEKPEKSQKSEKSGKVDEVEFLDDDDDESEGDAVPDDLIEDEVGVAQHRVAELTADLQRLQAEYVNYKRRVDRDRELVAQNAVYKVLSPIVDVLDTIDRAREHGEVKDGFKAVADQLEQIVSKLGLTRFGEAGEVFDPNRHEALSHLGTDADVEETTVKVVAKAGYLIGDRVVRAAQVLVVDPE